MTEAELRAWAEDHATVGSAVAVAVLQLIGERDGLRRLTRSLAERVCDQSECLGRAAERRGEVAGG